MATQPNANAVSPFNSLTGRSGREGSPAQQLAAMRQYLQMYSPPQYQAQPVNDLGGGIMVAANSIAGALQNRRQMQMQAETLNQMAIEAEAQRLREENALNTQRMNKVQALAGVGVPSNLIPGISDNDALYQQALSPAAQAFGQYGTAQGLQGLAGSQAMLNPDSAGGVNTLRMAGFNNPMTVQDMASSTADAYTKKTNAAYLVPQLTQGLEQGAANIKATNVATQGQTISNQYASPLAQMQLATGQNSINASQQQQALALTQYQRQQDAAKAWQQVVASGYKFDDPVRNQQLQLLMNSAGMPFNIPQPKTPDVRVTTDKNGNAVQIITTDPYTGQVNIQAAPPRK